MAKPKERKLNCCYQKEVDSMIGPRGRAGYRLTGVRGRGKKAGGEP